MNVNLRAFLLAAVLAGTGTICLAQVEQATLDAKYSSIWTLTSLQSSRVNPEASVERRYGTDSKSITVTGEIRLEKIGNIIGFDQHNGFIVSKMLDDAGNDVTAKFSVKRDTSNVWYTPLRYDQRRDDDNTKWIWELAPVQMNIQLPMTPGLPRKLKLIEGNALAIVASKLEHIDVPFKVSDKPVEIVPGMEVVVKEATYDNGSFRLRFESPNGRQGGYRFHGMVNDREPLPEQIVLEQYFVDAEGNRLENNRRQGNRYPSAGGMSTSGTIESKKPIASIRFDIAVDPAEVPVPVKLTDIDLPDVAEVTKLFAAEPDQRKLPPLPRMEAALAVHLEKKRAGKAKGDWDDTKDQLVQSHWKSFVDTYNAPPKELVAKPILGTTPDAKTYDDYLGTYAISGAGAPAGMRFVVSKDEQGHYQLEIPEQGTLPAAARDGALFVVFDDVMIIPENILNPKSAPKLAGIWLIRSGKQTLIRMEVGRPSPQMTLERVEK